MTSKYMTVPVLVGVGVFATAVVVHKYYSKRPKKQLITLEDPNKEYMLPLIYRLEINHDTRLYRLGLPTKDHILGLPVGQHVFLSAIIDGKEVCKKYTPVTSDETRGYVDLVIKVYFKNVHPKFPEGGKMTQYVDSLKIGDEISVKGPTGRLVYSAPGRYDIRLVKIDPSSAIVLRAKKIVMIAGGSGIAPMLQLIRQVLRDPKDASVMSLLFANQSEDDILLRDELEECVKKYPKQLKVWYTIDRPTPSWKYSVGFISAEMISEHMFPPSPDTIILMCGPKPMIEFACTPNLNKLGYDSKMRFIY